MSKSEYLGPEPECIYVVVCDDKHRIYTREGQALNWFSKKISEGKAPELISYTKNEKLGG